MSNNPVVHFEMQYDNEERMTDFYTKAFGWKMTALGSGMENYVLAATSKNDEKGFPIRVGTINGGFYPKKPDIPVQHPSVVIAVDDIYIATKEVEKAGGKVLGKPRRIEGFGIYVSFTDSEGNKVSMMQPDPRE